MIDTPPAADSRAGAPGYFLLTGASAFGSRTVMQTIVAHVNEVPRPAAGLRPHVPPALPAVIAIQQAAQRQSTMGSGERHTRTTR